MTGRMPRGRCRWCGKTYALKKDGRLWHHVATVAGASFTCSGSGQVPA